MNALIILAIAAQRSQVGVPDGAEIIRSLVARIGAFDFVHLEKLPIRDSEYQVSNLGASRTVANGDISVTFDPATKRLKEFQVSGNAIERRNRAGLAVGPKLTMAQAVQVADACLKPFMPEGTTLLATSADWLVQSNEVQVHLSMLVDGYYCMSGFGSSAKIDRWSGMLTQVTNFPQRTPSIDPDYRVPRITQQQADAEVQVALSGLEPLPNQKLNVASFTFCVPNIRGPISRLSEIHEANRLAKRNMLFYCAEYLGKDGRGYGYNRRVYVDATTGRWVAVTNRTLDPGSFVEPPIR